jgi:SAM-dependent methyltransferase
MVRSNQTIGDALLNRGRAYAGRIELLVQGYHFLSSLLRHRQGYKYGESLPTGTPPALQADPTALEAYFDVHTEGPGIWKWRHYFPIYERHFRKFIGREVRVVEIGIFSGGSLGMWHDYFGEGAQVYGVDIEPACKAYEGPGTRVFIGDQADPAFWQGFLRDVPEFDIVIDDGGHAAQQLIPTLEALLPHLRPGGVYLCEDVCGRSHAFHDYLFGLSRHLHAVGPGDYENGIRPTRVQRTIDSVHLYPFVSVIEKRESRLDELVAPKHGTQWQPFYDARGEVFPR